MRAFAVRPIAFAIIVLLSGVGAASASCEMVGGTVAADGVCEIPRSVLARYSVIEQAKAKLYARRNGIRWRIVDR